MTGTSRHTLQMLASLTALLAVFLTGCAPKKLPAYGAANQLTIVTNLSSRDEAVLLLKSTFARPLVSVDEDTLYIADVLISTQYAKYSKRYDASRNLVFLVDITKRDGLTRRVQGLLGTNTLKQIENGPAEYFVHSNVWALAQTVVIIAGAGRESLVHSVRTLGDRIYAETDSMITERTKDTIYAGDGVYGGRGQTSTSGQIASRYGWSLRIPPGFEASGPDTVGEGLLVRFRTGEPTRMVFVYWAPQRNGDPADPKKCLELRAALALAAYGQDAVGFTKASAGDAVFEGRNAVKIEGVWENKEFTTRGPFFTYCFATGSRFYMLDAVIDAPGTRKGALFKQLEAIIRTFKG